MWVLFKLGVVALAFLSRWVWRLAGRMSRETIKVDGVTFFISQSKTKNGVVVSTSIGLKIDSSLHFRITPESRWDALFKRLGFAHEIQTADELFDLQFYISSDCSAFQRMVIGKLAVRKHLSRLMSHTGATISYDGSTLWLTAFGDLRQEVRKISTHLIGISNFINEFDRSQLAWWKQSGNLKIITIEAVIWSCAAYAALSLTEWALFKGDVHVNPYLLAFTGTLAGIFATALFCFAVLAWMGRSSRSHRLFLESAFVLTISMPFAGTQAVIDLNTGLRQPEAVVTEVALSQVYRTEHRGRRGRRYYRYHADLIRTPDLDKRIPDSVELSFETYRNLNGSTRARIALRDGALGFAWIESIEPVRP
jgi:hypothetical protein